MSQTVTVPVIPDGRPGCRKSEHTRFGDDSLRSHERGARRAGLTLSPMVPRRFASVPDPKAYVAILLAAKDRFREGFRMPARRERSTRVRGPASESPRRRNPRDSGGWPMGIWRGSGFGEGWFSQDRREMKAADDCALAAAAVLDGVIEDQPVRPCRRLQAPG